jgi:hypothetical protein
MILIDSRRILFYFVMHFFFTFIKNVLNFHCYLMINNVYTIMYDKQRAYPE